MCSVPRERVDKSSMATSVTGDSGDSWGGMSVVAIISLRTPKVEEVSSSMLIPVARIDKKMRGQIKT